VPLRRVQARHRVDDHLREEGLLAAHQLAVEARLGAPHQQLPQLGLGPPLERHAQRSHARHGRLCRCPVRAHDGARVHAVLDEGLGLAQQLGRQQDHGGRAVAHLGVLRKRDIHQGLGRRVHHIQ